MRYFTIDEERAIADVTLKYAFKVGGDFNFARVIAYRLKMVRIMLEYTQEIVGTNV